MVTAAPVPADVFTTPGSWAACLMSPWADLAAAGQTITAKADVDPIITADAVRVRGRDYLDGVGTCDPAVSPVYASLAGLPPLHTRPVG